MQNTYSYAKFSDRSSTSKCRISVPCTTLLLYAMPFLEVDKHGSTLLPTQIIRFLHLLDSIVPSAVSFTDNHEFSSFFSVNSYSFVLAFLGYSV